MAGEQYEVPSADALRTMSIAQIAREVRKFWPKPYFGAVPYLDAMGSLHSDTDKFICDDAQTIVTYFLGNAGNWRGEAARTIKAELKRRFKLK